MKKKINVGILGLANIAKRSLIPSILKLPNEFVLKGVASRDSLRAEKFAKDHNCRAFESYSDLIINGDIDAIYIPLPNSLHYEWAKLALEKNIHVLSEKPLTTTLNQTIELVDIARMNNILLFETFQFRFHRQLKVLIEMIKKGCIGEIRNIKATFCFPPLDSKDNIRYNYNLGGGALLDAGAYTTKISQILLGHNLIVKEASLAIPAGYEVDIFGSVLLEEKSTNITSFLHFGFDNFYQCGVEILGTTGKIHTNRLFTARNDYVASIVLEKSDKIESIKVDPDDHFVNMLLHTYNLMTSQINLEDEYSQNIDQARLIEEIKIKSTT
tara:strand:+ start:242 stop:1222 length:981 start_codon:yes stop_codon:yes gene_type:complete